MSFTRYVVLRALRAVFVVIGAAILIFILVRLLPGDPARLALGPQATADQVASLRHVWGLDQPLYAQFVNFLHGLLVGDWGASLRTRDPVLVDIGHFFPATLELTLFGTVVTVVFGFPLGVIAATNRNKTRDHASRLFSLAGLALPQFWLAVMLQLLLAYHVGILPIFGRISLGMAPPTTITGLFLIDSLLTLNGPAFYSSFVHLLLPGFILALQPLSQISRYTRSSVIEEMDKDYVHLAGAYGLPKRLIYYGYILKNALPAAMTQLALIFGYSLGGAIIIESVFSWPGMGLYLVESIYYKDLNAVTGSVIVIAIAISTATFVNDLLNAYIDPRIKLGERH